MNRRSLLGLLLAAPIAAPAAMKSAVAGNSMGGVAGGVVKLTLDSSDLGNITAGLISNADGSFVMDIAKQVMIFEGEDAPQVEASAENYWGDLHEVYEESDDGFEFDDFYDGESA